MRSELAGASDTRWVSLQEPAPDELAQLVRETKLETVDAEFVAQDHHRPEVAVRPDYILLLIHVPVFNRTARVTTGGALYFIIGRTTLMTVHYQPIVALEKIVQEYEQSDEKRNEYLSDDPLALALHIIGLMYGSAFHKLERLSKHVDIAEDAVFQGNERKMVEEISILIRDVIDFRKAIRPQRSLFRETPRHDFFTTAHIGQWRRLDGQVRKVWDMLDSLYESSKELRDTNKSLLLHKENELLRLLTYYSIIAIPVWILLTPFTPQAGAPLREQIVYWAGVGLLALLLLFIFLRFRGKRIL